MNAALLGNMTDTELIHYVEADGVDITLCPVLVRELIERLQQRPAEIEDDISASLKEKFIELGYTESVFTIIDEVFEHVRK